MSTQSEKEKPAPTEPNHTSDQQPNKNEDDGLHQEIQKIQDNLTKMTLVINEGGQQRIEQIKNLPSHHGDVRSLLSNFNEQIEKICKNAKEKPNSDDESMAKGRSELSQLDMEILDDPAMENFQVTYNYLQESRLRFCLFFLSIFPENAVIRKRPLIYWWIGEGLISTEKIGEDMFEELLKLELIIPHGNGMNPLVNKCIIHPWVRYLLISLAKKAGLLGFDSKNIPRFDIITFRRACLLLDDKSLSQKGYDDKILRNLRSIFNVNKRYVSFGSKELAIMESLVVLQLGRWQDLPTHHIEVVNEAFLKDLRTQKHLKYISLRGISRITALPDSIVELSNLEILDLKACHNLEKLPEDISPLKRLTHLDVSECYLLESMPKGLDKLTSLEVLKGFVIGNSEKTPCRIRDLGKLGKLKRLSIHIGSEAVVQEGEFQTLKDLKSVERLKISWGVVSKKHKEQVVKESFSFPPRLDKLDFEGLPYKELPKWLVPSNLKELKKLYIKGGELENLKHQDKEGTWKVEILRLHHLKSLKYEVDLKEFFPSLRYGQIMNEQRIKEIFF